MGNLDTSRVPELTKLNDYPSLAQPYFEAFEDAGAPDVCIFGSAVRDADCGGFYKRDIPIDVYDMRVWTLGFNHETKVSKILGKLIDQDADIRRIPTLPQHDAPTYEIKLLGGTINLSFHSMAGSLFFGQNASDLVAQERAAECPIGLNAIALDKNMEAWALPQYFNDRISHAITVLPSTENDDVNIKTAQALRDSKYPGHGLYLP